MSLSRPDRLAAHHVTEGFGCGTASLDHWLKQDAFDAQRDGTSRTFVTCDGHRVLGYYTLASGRLGLVADARPVYRAVPEPIPVAVISRMALDRSWQGRGIGRALFRDGALRILRAAQLVSIRGIVVDAISAESRAFYMALGFDASPTDTMTLTVSLADLRAVAP